MSSGSYRSSGNWGKKTVQFTLQDAERIAAAVQASERGRRGRKPSTLPRAAGSAAGGGASVVEATFHGAWQLTQGKHVNVAVGGQFTAATTLYVINQLNIIPPSGSPRTCYVYLQDEASNSWRLVNARV